MSPSVLSKALLLVKYRARALSYTWATIIGVLVASKGIPPLVPTLGAIVAMSGTALSVYIFNEIMDLSVDQANKVDRPLARGMVQPREAAVFSTILTVIGLLAAILTNIATFAVCAAFLVLGYAYSVPPTQLKSRFMLKQTTVALGAFLSSIAGGAAIGIMSWTVLFAGLMFFMMAFSLSPVLDLGDIEGDAFGGRRTLPLTFGPRNTIVTALILMAVMIVLSFIGFFRLDFNILLPISVSLLCLLCGWTLYPILRHLRDYAYIHLQVKKWIAIHFMVQISVFVGALPLPI